MDSVDKLREHLADCTQQAGTDAHRFDTYWITKDAADAMIDEIEAEIERDYMRLPVDADGVPIRVGDLLKEPPGTDYGIVEVIELTYDGDDWYFKGEVPMSFMGLAGYFNTAGWTHYHAPTVEDVLSDAALAIVDVSYVDVPGIGNVPKLSVDDFKLREWMELNHDKLREVMRDDR